MKKRITGLMILACLLTGCQEVPQQVRDQMGEQGQTKQLQAAGCTYCTVEQLRDITRDTISHEPANLILPEKIDFSDVEEIGLVTFKSRENFFENMDAVAEYFGVEVSEWEHDKGEYEWYSYEGEGIYVSVADNGIVSYNSGEYDALIQQDIYPETVLKVHLNRESCPEFACRFKDGNAMLEDVVQNANAWMKQCRYCSPDFDYRLRTIYVSEYQDRHYLTMLYQPMYKGVGLSYITYPLAQTEDYSVVIEAVESSVTLWMEHASDVSGFSLQNNVTVEKEEMAEQVIDFESALKLVEEKMAGYSRLKVSEVRIEYILKPRYSPEKGEYAYGPGVIMEARPVYSFWIPSGGVDEGYGICESNETVYVNVDMLDGTVTDDFAPYSYRGQ